MEQYKGNSLCFYGKYTRLTQTNLFEEIFADVKPQGPSARKGIATVFVEIVCS